MTRSAHLKLQRAMERIAELDELLREQRPFRYVVETNTKTGERATFSKKIEPVIEQAALIAGDAAHNIRASLDHAYWAAVSPLATTDSERRKIQFPFVETETRLNECVKHTFARRVSESFFDAIIKLAPHPERGGNRMLYLINQIDVIDKHRMLTPMGDYKHLTFDLLRKQIPDLPKNLAGTGGFGLSRRDIVWHIESPDPKLLGTPILSDIFLFEKELDVPVEVVFDVRSPNFFGPAIPTLKKLLTVARETIAAIESAAP